ncbi:MAG: GNAT family N-acetyltransferase [Solirubrobacterales bacterium]
MSPHLEESARARLEVEIVSDPAKLEAFEAAWRELAVARANAFVTPEWFLAWHRHYGPEHEPLVCAVRGPAGDLRGVLPLVLARNRPRTVRFAGSALGDHFHPAASEDEEELVASAAARALRACDRRWSAIVLENVGADAAWWRELSQRDGLAPVIDRSSVLPYARLADRSWNEYMASRSRNLRSQVARRLRALERHHHVRVRWTGAVDRVTADMESLFRLHDARWQARTGESSLTSERARAFHADFASLAHRRGWLRLCFLDVDERPVAAWYGWRIGERFAYYQAGFDPAWADRSVGFVLFAQTIRSAAEENAAEYDMLLGDEPFKARFADSERRVCTVLIAPRMAPARLLAIGETRLRRAASRLPHGLRESAKRYARALLDRLPMARRR